MAESVVVFDPYILFAHISTQSQCQDSHVWSGWYPRVRTAVLAVLLLYYLFVIPTIFSMSRHRFNSASHILAWYSFPPANFFAFMWILLALTGDVYLNCLKISVLEYLKIFAAVNAFRYLASVIMLGIVMLPIPIAIIRQSGTNTQNTRMAHMALFGLVSVFGLVHTAIWDVNNIRLLTGDEQISPAAANTMGAIYFLLYLIASLAAGIRIVYSVWTMRVKGHTTGSLFPFGIALAVSQIAYALVDVCAILAFKVVHRKYTESASATFASLSLFFQACVFAFVCLVAQSSALEGGRLRSVDYGSQGKTTGPRWSRKFSI